MIVEYWLAGYIGRAWLRLRPGGSAVGSEDCRLVAHGGKLPAGKLWDAQHFAVRAWTVAAMACVALFCVVALAAEALPNGSVRNAAAYVVLALPGVAALAIGQIAMIAQRGRQTQRFVLRGGRRAAMTVGEPRRGQPRARDFWVMLVVMILFAGSILYGEFAFSG
jgi:hypothetical protein